MIVTCHNCTTRLQLDDSKVPARPFGVRCPKCQEIINAQPAQRDALAAVGDVPPSGRTSRRESDPAPVAQVAPPEPVNAVSAAPLAASASGVSAAPPKAMANAGANGNANAQDGATPEGELLRLLGSLLRRAAAEGEAAPAPAAHRPGWKRRRALVCTGPSYGGEISRVLSDDGYEVFVAPDAAQAAERLREEGADVLVLDPEFDMGRQGGTQIVRELASMRMPERRRVVYVQLAPNERTGDAHAAFLAGANLVVNPREVRTLPRALEKNIHDLNELYRDYNRALGLAEL